MLESGADDPLGTLVGGHAEVHRQVVGHEEAVASQGVGSLGVLPEEGPVDPELGDGHGPDVGEQVQLLPHRDVGGLDVGPGVPLGGRGGGSLEDHVALLQLLEGVVGDGLHDLGPPLDGEAVDLPDLHLAGGDLVGQEKLHDLLGGGADVGSDAVPSADSDDELVQLGVVHRALLGLQLLHSLELSPNEGAELLLRRLDGFLVYHFYRIWDGDMLY